MSLESNNTGIPATMLVGPTGNVGGGMPYPYPMMMGGGQGNGNGGFGDGNGW